MSLSRTRTTGTMICIAASLSALCVASVARGQAPSDNLPSAESIIAKYVEAIGGKAVHENVKSRHMAGRFAVPAQNMTATLEIFSAAPNKEIVHIVIPGQAEIHTGYNGEHGWLMHPAFGNQVLEGSRLEDGKMNAEFQEYGRYDKYIASMETVEETDFEGKPCYKVKLEDKNGKESLEYFEKDTGLLRGRTGKRESAMGTIDVVEVNQEWKDVDGMKFPVKILTRAMGQEQVITIEKLELNNVDPAVFETPEPIKKVLSGEAPPQGNRPPGLQP